MRPLQQHLAGSGLAMGALPVRALAPGRLVLFVVGGLALIWLIVRHTLPYALAERSPELALMLNPHQPVALLVMANRARSRLQELAVARARRKGPAPAAASDDVVSSTGAPPPAPASPEAEAEERRFLREEIRSLASRIIAADPLNAQAFRLLAETEDDIARRRGLMQEAFKRSRRELVAVLWLMDDSFARQDYPDVIAKADIVLRIREQLLPHLMSYLGPIAATDEGRKGLLTLLERKPLWRRQFFAELPTSTAEPSAALALMLALKAAGHPPTREEMASYLGFLIGKGDVELAYNAWLQLIPQDKLGSLGLLNNAAFTQDPSGLPFDWTINRGQNTVVDLVPLADGEKARALRIGFGGGRIRFPETIQVLLLTPGRYRLEGAFQGSMAARRGLRWEIRCLGGRKPTLAETDMIHGSPRGWQRFAVPVEVPDRQDCRAQEIRLYHPARSASEEMITGEVLFRDLRLARIEPE